MVRGAGDRNPHDNCEQDVRVTAARQVRRQISPECSSMTQELDIVTLCCTFLLTNL